MSVTIHSGVKETNGDSLASIDWMLDGDGGGRKTYYRYILTCLFVFSLILSWTFGILAHEEDQLSYVYKILGIICVYSTQTD